MGARRMALAAALGALVAASPTGAQEQAMARLEVRAVAAADRRALDGAALRVEGVDTATVRADAAGVFRTLTLAPGRYVLRVRALGYIARADTVDLAAGATAARTVALAPAALALDQLVVTAARRAQRLADAVTTVEVVSRADLERSGATDLSAVLIEQTGIDLQGGHPAGTGVMLQGIGSERVLVLLDGQPLAGRLSGTFDLSRIPVAMVERVEVVKGAQSTLYGSEAMGGVVNIITRAPGEAAGVSEAMLTATAGEQGRRDATARVALGQGPWRGAVDVARRQIETTPGIDRTDGALSARLDGALKLRWSPDSARAMEASVLALDERQRWRTGTFHGFSDNVQLNARLGGHGQRGGHRIASAVSVSHYDHTSRSSTQALPIAGDTGQRQLQRIAFGEVLYTGRMAAWMVADAGLQVRVDQIETARVPGGLRTHRSLEPFAQLDLAPWRAVSLVPGVRVSHSSVWGTRTTPRVAARARLHERVTLRASVGDGFRAPDFKELFLFFQNTGAGYAVQGNPALRPETSRNTMLGLEYAAGGAYLRTQLFHNAFRDFIETRMVSAPHEAPVYEYANRDRGSTRGLELEAGANLVRSGRARGELGYTVLATRDDATGRALLGRPSHAARAALTLPLPFAVRGSFIGLHTGRTAMQRDADTGAITAWRDAFTRIDVRVARAIESLGVEAVVGVDNVFDRRPDQWAGFTGRHVYTSLSWTPFGRTSR